MKIVKILAILAGVVVFACVGLFIIGMLASGGNASTAAPAATKPPENFACESPVAGDVMAPVREKTSDLTLITYTVLPSSVGHNLYGVMCNTTGEMRGEITVIVKMFDQDDKLISTSVADGKHLFGTMPTVLPGKRVQFSMGTEKLEPGQAYGRVDVVVSSRAHRDSSLYRPAVKREMELSALNVTPADNGGVILGKITNKSDEVVTKLILGAIAYNAAGEIIAARTDTVNDAPVDAGATIDFQLAMNLMVEQPATVEYFVEGVTVEAP